MSVTPHGAAPVLGILPLHPALDTDCDPTQSHEKTPNAPHPSRRKPNPNADHRHPHRRPEPDRRRRPLRFLRLASPSPVGVHERASGVCILRLQAGAIVVSADTGLDRNNGLLTQRPGFVIPGASVECCTP
jgi:hypothetical protein